MVYIRHKKWGEGGGKVKVLYKHSSGLSVLFYLGADFCIYLGTPMLGSRHGFNESRLIL